MTVEAFDESIQQAVAREAARRKRVLLAFMALLLVPIAIGAYALTRAKTETEKLASDVTPIVTKRVSGEITAVVTKDIESRTEPLIRQNVDSATYSLRSEIASLQTSVKRTSDAVATFRSISPEQQRLLLEVAEDREFRQTLTRELAAIRALANTSVQTANANKEAIAAISRRLAAAEGDVKRLQTRVTTERVPR